MKLCARELCTLRYHIDMPMSSSSGTSWPTLANQITWFHRGSREKNKLDFRKGDAPTARRLGIRVSAVCIGVNSILKHEKLVEADFSIFCQRSSVMECRQILCGLKNVQKVLTCRLDLLRVSRCTHSRRCILKKSLVDCDANE